jgi:DNA mismatch endonuclease Vsr
MRAVKSKNTKPELVLRKALFALGYRYYIHYRKIPGSPDIVFPRRKVAIFVNGCFWHRHDCSKANMPRVRVSYWQKKFQRNVQRDAENYSQLRAMGWKVIIVWECQIERNLRQVVLRTARSIERTLPQRR